MHQTKITIAFLHSCNKSILPGKETTFINSKSSINHTQNQIKAQVSLFRLHVCFKLDSYHATVIRYYFIWKNQSKMKHELNDNLPSNCLGSKILTKT